MSVALSASNRAGIIHGIRSIDLKVVAPTGDDRQAVIVKELDEVGPAQTVLRSGDRILKVGDRSIRNGFDLERAFWSNKAGDQVKITVLRDGERMEVALTVADATKTDAKD